MVQKRRLTSERRMPASPASVWSVFADFPGLAEHWDGLRSTRAIGEQTSGVGARRRVELKPVGSMEETVTHWEEGQRLDTENQPSASVPFRHAESSLRLEPDSEGTLVTFEYRYVPRGGPLAGAIGPVIDKMLSRTFADMLRAVDGATNPAGNEN